MSLASQTYQCQGRFTDMLRGRDFSTVGLVLDHVGFIIPVGGVSLFEEARKRLEKVFVFSPADGAEAIGGLQKGWAAEKYAGPKFMANPQRREHFEPLGGRETPLQGLVATWSDGPGGCYIVAVAPDLDRTADALRWHGVALNESQLYGERTLSIALGGRQAAYVSGTNLQDTLKRLGSRR